MSGSRWSSAPWMLLAGILVTVAVSQAQEQIPCPEMPDKITQINRDVSVDVNVAVGSLGKLKAGNIGVKTDVAAKNLFDKYPNTDRILIAQTMAATYCVLIRDSKDLKDADKRRLWTEFSDRILKFENSSYHPEPRPSSKQSAPTAPPASVTQNGDKDIVQIGNNNHATINPDVDPNKPVVTYDFDGFRRMSSPGLINADDGELATFSEMKSKSDSKDWSGLLSVSDAAKKRAPEWLTPYYAASEAYAKLCQKQEALRDMKYFVKRAKGVPSFENAVSSGEKILADFEVGKFEGCQ